MALYAETLTRSGRYPLCDPPPAGHTRNGSRARWTGEKRPPLAGEWYLSGAIIGAYRAPNDLSTAYHIAELVTGRLVTSWRDEPDPPATPIPPKEHS